MHPKPSRARLFVFLLMVALPLLAGAAEVNDPDQVGVVSKAENEVQIISALAAIPAIVGTPVHLRDELKTGTAARLQVRFRDDTVLTLGERASVTVDRYVFDPDKNAGETFLRATEGAFRFVTGRIKQLKDKTIAVETPVAQIGVRGTEFWGGPIDAKYGVLLLEGEVTVSNQAGSVTLSEAGQGSNIPSPVDPPDAPSAWAAVKIARAVDSVALH